MSLPFISLPDSASCFFAAAARAGGVAVDFWFEADVGFTVIIGVVRIVGVNRPRAIGANTPSLRRRNGHTRR